MRQILKRIVSWILYIAILIGLIYGIPQGLSELLKTSYPMASITSGSMWPALKKGDLIFIKGMEDKNEIKISDIVVYQNPWGFTIHRVIRLQENTLITKGDANNVEDAPVKYEDIIGKALTFKNRTVRIPNLGLLSVLAHKKL